MEGSLGLGRLLRWVRERGASPAPDAADAGTAFGMEMALEAGQAETDKARGEPPPAPSDDR